MLPGDGDGRVAGGSAPTLSSSFNGSLKKCWAELGEAQATILDNTTLLDPVNIATMYVAQRASLLTPPQSALNS